MRKSLRFPAFWLLLVTLPSIQPLHKYASSLSLPCVWAGPVHSFLPPKLPPCFVLNLNLNVEKAHTKTRHERICTSHSISCFTIPRPQIDLSSEGSISRRLQNVAKTERVQRKLRRCKGTMCICWSERGGGGGETRNPPKQRVEQNDKGTKKKERKMMRLCTVKERKRDIGDASHTDIHNQRLKV